MFDNYTRTIADSSGHRHGNVTTRQDARIVLKLILEHEFYEWTYTGAFTTLDIIHEMLNDAADCPLAALILSKLTRCMDDRMSMIVCRKFGVIMKEAAL